MKVLVFASLYPNNVWPHNGVFVKERMTQFARQSGCDVQVVAPIPYFPPLKIGSYWRFSQIKWHEVIEGLEVYHPRYAIIPKVGMALQGWLMFLSLLPTIKRLQRTFDFDVIDAHYVYPDGFAAVLLGHWLGKPVVVSARGSDINLFKDFPLIRRFLHYTMMKANGVITVSQALKDAACSLGIPAEKMTVIPNGVDTRKFFPLPQAEARKRLGLTNQRIILSVGRLCPNKGFDILIRAFKILLEKCDEPSPSLVLIGDGAFRKPLEEMIASACLQDHIQLIGEVPHAELALWYSAADVFCLASGREGWPNVLLEALACGRPVVATAVGGVPEIIRSDAIGFLTERNEWDIAEKLTLALHKSWRSDIIINYAQTYTWDQVVLSVGEVFASVLPDRVNFPVQSTTCPKHLLTKSGN
jgi:glycosyltransferase involved in cell wall biosynthesis